MVINTKPPAKGRLKQIIILLYEQLILALYNIHMMKSKLINFNFFNIKLITKGCAIGVIYRGKEGARTL